MRKSKIYIILLLISIISCKNVEQEKIKIEPLKDSTLIEQKIKTKETVEDTKTKTKFDDSKNIQEEEEVKENKNKLRLKFTIIESTDYLDYKQKYSNGVIIDSTKNVKAGKYFTLMINNKKEKYSCNEDSGNCTYYQGFIESLNCYVLTFCESGYCGTYLLDKDNGISYRLGSPFDSECEAPSLSKDQSKLIAFSSSVFDRKSFIALYKIKIETKQINFKEFDSFYTSDWRIKEIIWIDNNSIALKIYDEYGGKTGGELINESYLKGEIK